MTTLKRSLIRIMFTIFNSNPNEDLQMLMTAVDGLITSHWVVWTPLGRKLFMDRINDSKVYRQDSRLFAEICERYLDWFLFDLKSANGNLKLEEVF